MRYWLLKTEPSAFSIDDLAKKKVSMWDGVRNYQARNYLRSMSVGDLVLIYHSSVKPAGIVGVGKVVSKPYADPTQFDKASHHFDPSAKKDNPRWFLVDVEFIKKFKTMVTLEQIKADAFCKEMVVVKKSRLSVQPVEEKHFNYLLNKYQ